MAQSAAISYVVLLVVVGVPVWWATTKVYRFPLPYGDIEALGSSTPKHKIMVQLVSEDAQGDHQLGPKVQQSLVGSDVFEFLLTSRAPSRDERDVIEKSKDVVELDEQFHKLHGDLPAGTVMLVRANKQAADKIVVGKHRAIFFSSQASPEEVVKQMRNVVLAEPLMKSSYASTDIRRVAAAADGYDILFSLVLPQPDVVRVDWDIEEAVATHIDPFLSRLGNFSSFSVMSQVLYLSRLNVVPRQEGDRFVLAASDLSLAIHPVESQLASHVSSKPRINFLVYVPPRESSPLHILDSRGDATAENAFLIPSWGGVVFYNVPARETSALVDTDKVMEVFLSQLRQLLGLVAHTHLPKGLHLIPLKDGVAIRDWERDFLLRRRTADNLSSSRSTLQSLAGLLEQISNIVIRDEVGQEVVAAVDAFDRAEEALEHASLEKAFANSERAYIASERAFFDSTLLELLYFPEDQKYAIYIPLFLPVGIPIILSLRSIFRAKPS